MVVTEKLAPHIKDLITAYTAMPESKRREAIIRSLQEAYLLATSDSLELTLKET